MESFIVVDLNQPKPGDANYESLRTNKTKIPPATERNYRIAAFNIAIKMIECFSFMPWMAMPDVTSANGERINNDGEVYMPKFKRGK